MLRSKSALTLRARAHSTGKVFDVSPKREMYSPGKGYHIFAGKDGSRGLGMSSLKPEDAVSDYSTLDDKQLKVLDDWVAYYTKSVHPPSWPETQPGDADQPFPIFLRRRYVGNQLQEPGVILRADQTPLPSSHRTSRVSSRNRGHDGAVQNRCRSGHDAQAMRPVTLRS